jgi:hypothetical protein
MSILRPLKGLISVLQRLLGVLVSGLVVLFSVVHCGSTVRVCREFMKLCSSLVGFSWHSVAPPGLSNSTLMPV